MDDKLQIEIPIWLDGLGLGGYSANFTRHDIEPSLLFNLTSTDLLEIGVRSVGHRRRIMSAIAQLGKTKLPNENGETSGHPIIEPFVPLVVGSDHQMHAQWRPITLMFCDLVGSTELATLADAEELRQFFADFRAMLTRAIQKYNGAIASYNGDGIVAYFGYPQMFGLDVERAVRAGLHILEEVSKFPAFGNHHPQVRIGGATGLTIISEAIGPGEVLAEGAIGAIPNLASRVQSAAQPGTFFIAPSTHKHIGNIFECADLGHYDLKGFIEPVQLWQVLRERPTKSRFEALRTIAKQVPVFGRDSELSKLRERLAVVRLGIGEVMIVLGEPGTGKSRLVEQAFAKQSHDHAQVGRDQDSGCEPFILQCSPYNASVAFYPLRSFFDRIAHFGVGDTPITNARKLHAYLNDLWPIHTQQFALICEFLGLPQELKLAPEIEPSHHLNQPELQARDIKDLNSLEKRNRTLQVFLLFLEAMAAKTSVFFVEDAHWIDPSTVQLLEAFIKIIRRLPVLMVVTSRPGQSPLWLDTPHTRSITLDKLYPEDTADLIIAIAEPHQLPSEVLQAIIERSDGVPIFAEELTRGYLEQGERNSKNHHFGQDDLTLVPSTLTESLLARLDSLTYGRQIAPIAAVLSREFPVNLLQEVTLMPEAEMRLGLRELLDAGVLVPGHSRYGETVSFRHMLMRDAAYQMLLRHDRKRLHARVAEIMETKFQETSALIPHILAFQLTGAGEMLRAALKWGEAGYQAGRNCNSEETIDYYNHAIEANSQLPPSIARDERELSYRLAIVEPMVLTKGFGSQSVSIEIAAAIMLSQKLGAKSQIIRVLAVKWGSFTSVGGMLLSDTYQIAVQIRDLAKDGNDFDRMISHRVMGPTLMFQGHFAQALPELLCFFEIYRSELHDTDLEAIGPSNHVVNLTFWLAECYAIQNDFDNARLWQTRCISIARQAGHANAILAALSFGGCLVSALMRDEGLLNQHASELRSTILVSDSPLWRGQANLYTGIMMINQHRKTEGFALALQAIDELRTVRFVIMNSTVLVAEACQLHGRLDDCEKILADTRLSINDGWVNMSAEYYRIEGLLFQSRGNLEKACTSFHTAIATAKTQGATLFQMRAEAALAALPMLTHP